MTLDVVRGRGLVDQVFEQLATEIMTGTYAPGEHLPSERALAETLAVNRQVVREASRRLSQMGLVQVVHRDGTHVLDFRAHGGLDLLTVLMVHGPRRKPLQLWMPILEMRSALAPDVVRHCTLRGKQALRDEILEVARQMRDAGDPEQVYTLEQRFWDLVHEGADHLVYRLTYNSFKHMAASSRDGSKRFTAMEVKHAGYRVELARAIAAGDAARAEREVRTSMRHTLDVCEAEIERRRSASKPATEPRKVAKTSAARAATEARPRAREPATEARPKPRAKVAPLKSKTASKSVRPSAKVQSSLTAKPPPRKKASIL